MELWQNMHAFGTRLKYNLPEVISHLIWKLDRIYSVGTYMKMHSCVHNFIYSGCPPSPSPILLICDAESHQTVTT